jgi:mannose-6-phosphate isomerase-like protein (cupin superfamily)
MKGYIDDIEDRTEDNRDFRRVVYTGKHLQLVLMSIPVEGEIGEETHDDGDQFFRVEEGLGEVMIDGRTTRIESGSAVVVPAGARHNIINIGREPLKLYTLYGPPHHAEGIVQKTKAEADASREHFTGATTE